MVSCPHPGCKAELARKDVTSLDASPDKQEGAVHAILRRLRSNQTVRCKHHRDHYGKSFGREAKAVESKVKCNYVGDLTSIHKHMTRDCPVQHYLDGKQLPMAGIDASAPKTSTVAGARLNLRHAMTSKPRKSCTNACLTLIHSAKAN